MSEERVISSESIYNGKLVNLRVDTVDLDGTPVKREIVEHGGAVTIVPIDEDGNVVMVRQFRSGSRSFLLELPAGGLNPAESPEDAARRELQEEIGYYPEELIKLGGYWVAAAYLTEYITIYLSRNLRPSDLPADTDERIQLERVPFEEAIRRAVTGEFEDAKTLLGLMWATKYLKR